MVFIENDDALFRGPSRGNPTEVYVGGERGWEPYADAGKPKPIGWGTVISAEEAAEMMRELDEERSELSD